MLKNNDINKRTNANDHKALLETVPITVLPIPIVKTLVKVEAGANKLSGNRVALPMTIWTANASPKARAIPKTIAVMIPGKAARNKTR